MAVSKASQLLAVIAHIDETTLPLLYKALIVRPFLEFGNAVWGPFSKGDQKRLEKVQRRATRMLKSIKHHPYPKRLERLRLPSLFYPRRRGAIPYLTLPTLIGILKGTTPEGPGLVE